MIMGVIASPPDARPRLAGLMAAAREELPNGLTADEARRRLAKSGPNAMPDTTVHPLRMALEKFWAPVPWMLEAAIASARAGARQIR
jgi:H+-transporting ATPase